MNTTNLFRSTFSKIAIFALVLTIALGSVSSAFAQAVTPTVSTYAELPQRGQLVIPVGSQFVVPQEWDGLVVTIWRGMGDATVNPVVDFSNSIAKDRSDRYGGEPSDFQTVVWDKSVHPLPGFSGRQTCDDAFGHDAATLVVGTSIGDAGCFEMIEFDQSSHPVQIVAPTIAYTSTPLPSNTPTPTATLAFTPTPSVEASVTPSATPTSDPNVVYHRDVTITNSGLTWFGILLLAIGFFGLLFRRPAVVQAPVQKTPARRKTAATKKKSEPTP